MIAGAVSELNRTSFLQTGDISVNASLGIVNLSVQKNNIQLENDAFVSNFQIYITQHYPVYLVMTGLYDNISNLQNEKSLTFLYRAPKIFLAPLSIPSMTTSYRTVFDIAPKEAVQMAKLTKGYPFAFQILGYLKWENRSSIEKLLPDFDEALASYAYEKIWSELS